jgi:PAS domain S-box-containing protein
MTAEEITEQLFEVASQFNRGGTLIVDRGEKAEVATINLRTGRKAKASTAYASARAYFAAGMALLDEKDWGNQYELTFSLGLECVECELLSGNFETAEQLIAELSQRGTSKVDQAAVCRLKIQLHEVKGECVQGVDSALRCLRLFGIDLPAQPTWERVQAEYETVWSNLKGRPIEDLIDLPLMSDREIQAAMQVLSTLLSSAYFTDLHLNCLHLCRMLNLSMQHGVSGASAHACGWLGVILGHVFHRYQEGYRFAKLACDLAEKHGFIADKAKILESRGLAAFWTQPLANAIDFNRAALRAATESGDLNYACYFMHEFVEFLLQGNRPLEEVWYESQRALDFARKARFRDVADLIVSQQHFIATMQLRTARFSTFSDAQLDEVAFEAQLTGDRMPMLTGWYWILKTKARFLSGDYAGALTAAGKAKALLWTTVGEPMVLDYFYYTALTVAACYEKASVDQQREWRGLLTAHLEQLREWTDNYPPTFADKHALVSGEIARLEGRDAEAMRLYEQAIKSARQHGFVQNEGLAHEVAAGFYAARGVENIAYTYLRNARDCYLRWGALGKVQQLDQRHPGLREKVAPSALSATVSAPVEQLDVGTVVKASQAVSSEIELGKLFETLMRVSLEHAGAERGLLILLRGDEPRIEAEATSRGGHVEVTLRQAAVSPAELPESVLHTAVRTRESVILEDASAQIPFSADPYVRQKRARSVLCLPLVKQAKLVGAVYLENNLTAHAFTTGRIAVLELVASQAAISLENAALYVALKESEEQWRDVFENNPIMYFMIDAAGTILAVNPLGAEQLGYRVDELVGQPVQRIIYASDREPVEGHLAHCLEQLGHAKGWEARKVCKDGTVLWVRETCKAVPRVNGAITLLACEDITVRRHFEAERERLQAQLRQSQKMEAIGTLAGGIAHDFNNILGAILGYGELAQQSVAADSDVHRYVSNVMRAGGRAKSLVERILAFSRRGVSEVGPVNVQAVVDETLELLAATSLAPTVRIERHLDAADAAILCEATQLHQVVMNLCTNALQAMESGGLLEVTLDQIYVEQDISLSHGTVAPGPFVRLCVADTGGGIPGHVLDRIFDPFFTTKSAGEGTGLGLSMVHGIVAGLGGAIDVRTMIGAGTTFTIWLPRAGEAVVRSAEPTSDLPHGNGETVLIVDNEKTLVALAEEILAELGYEPIGFSSSIVALGAFRDSPQRFDIVLTDEWMPELVGTDLASEIARLRPDLPIVLMSGFGGAHLHERARAVGIRELLRKPLRRRDIAECFDRVLRE